MDLIPCEFCGRGFTVDRYPGHSLLCALTSPALTLVTIVSPQGEGADYEDNLRLQDAMGGPVAKACRDINAAAPVADAHDMETCPVCLQEPSPATRVRRARACSHVFCSECLERWLSEHTTCPVCVADLSVHGGHRYVMDEEPRRRRLPAMPALLPDGGDRYAQEAAYHFGRVSAILNGLRRGSPNDG